MFRSSETDSTESERVGRFKPFVISFSYLLNENCSTGDTFTGDQSSQRAVKWLSSPDPSMNYNIARDTQHKGTAVWFIESSTFKEWKETGCLLWIQGNRMFLFYLCLRSGQWTDSIAGSGKSVLTCVA